MHIYMIYYASILHYTYRIPKTIKDINSIYLTDIIIISGGIK
jgi:hypothetical protein